MNRFQKQLIVAGEPMILRLRCGPSLVASFRLHDLYEAQQAGEPLPPMRVSIEDFEQDTRKDLNDKQS